MRTVRLPGGDEVVALGQGTWRMGERRKALKDEVAALRHGIANGMTLIDTAEMYGSGGAEKVVGEAIRGQRDAVYLVSKVLPSNAGRRRMVRACEKSLKCLGTDYLDLYLLHWRSGVSLDEVVEGFLALQEAGKIRRFGVSNFDVDDMDDLWETPAGQGCQTNQILYNLSRRWPEGALLPWSRRHGQPLMIYSPLEQGRLPEGGALGTIAAARGVTPMQVALAWVLRHDDVFVVPKASRIAHVDANLGVLDIALTDDELAALDEAFPAARRAARPWRFYSPNVPSRLGARDAGRGPVSCRDWPGFGGIKWDKRIRGMYVGCSPRQRGRGCMSRVARVGWVFAGGGGAAHGAILMCPRRTCTAPLYLVTRIPLSHARQGC